MPPRLSLISAFRSVSESLQSRIFSTTAPAAFAPRDRQPVDNSFRLANINRVNRQGGREGPADTAHDAASRILKYKSRVVEERRSKVDWAEKLREEKVSREMMKQMPRKFQAGDVYSPHDLSPVEMKKWKKRSPRSGDVVDALDLSPLDMYKVCFSPIYRPEPRLRRRGFPNSANAISAPQNFALIKAFTSSSGQILHSQHTKLRPVNQRRIAKMVRRAQGMGIYPSVHAHPEMLRDEFFSSGRSDY